MSGSTLDVCGTAYLGYIYERDDFIGKFIPNNGPLYMLRGDHDDSAEYHEGLFDDTWTKIDLKVWQYKVPESEFVLHQVNKSCEDNFSLISKHVKFVTEHLLVGEEAGEFMTKYFSNDPDLADKDFQVCIGQMRIRYPDSLDTHF